MSLLLAPLIIFMSAGESIGGPAIPPMPGEQASRTRTNVPHSIISTELIEFHAAYFYRDPNDPSRAGMIRCTLKKDGTA